MRLLRFPALLLSLFLQVAPVIRVVVADPALALSPVMAVLRIFAGAIAVAGAMHGVSGASPGTPTVSSTKTKVGAVGITFNYRILLSGGSPESYQVDPTPPGLSLTGANLRGTPTEPGESLSTVTAWDNSDFSGHMTSGEVTFLITDLEPLAPSVRVGGSVTFRILGPVTAQPTYRWFHNDLEIPNETGSTLTLLAVDESHAGQYHVRVAYGNTFVVTRKATLAVTPPSNPPTFTTTPTDAKLHETEALVLRAEATGEGELTFAWTKDGNPVPGEVSSMLQRAAVAPEDAGTYRVTVTGSGGSATSPPAVVTVDDPLEIGAVSITGNLFLVPFNGIAGRTYVLESQSNLGNPEWQNASEPLEGDVGSFSVPAADADSRVYRVRTN